MISSKVLPKRIMPFALVHKLLTDHGFRKRGSEEYPIYQALLQDSSTQTTYELNIPIQIDRNRKDLVKLGKAYIEQTEFIPSAIRQAIHCKLVEIADYLYRIRQQSIP